MSSEIESKYKVLFSDSMWRCDELWVSIWNTERKSMTEDSNSMLGLVPQWTGWGVRVSKATTTDET